MNNRIEVVLFISLLINILFVLLGALFIANKGGIYYLAGKINNIVNAKNKDCKTPYPPYYFHQKSQFEILPNFDSDIIFLGDSITDECEWAELLGNPNVKNRGISGDTIDRIVNRIDEIVGSKPKKIFLMVGINDFLNSGKSVRKTLEDYKKILLEIRQNTPNTQVFIESVLPVNNKINKFWLNNNIVIKFNDSLKELAKELSFEYINLFSHLADSQNQLDARYTLDGVHLNGQAYLVWKEVIKKYVVDPELRNNL
jgi:lysophospholipase L1-like esterase